MIVYYISYYGSVNHMGWVVGAAQLTGYSGLALEREKIAGVRNSLQLERAYPRLKLFRNMQIADESRLVYSFESLNSSRLKFLV